MRSASITNKTKNGFMKKLLFMIVMLNCFTIGLFSQQIISGKVTDNSTGEPLPGASVLIKGTSTGTVTNVDGDYEIAVSGPEDELVISFVGFLEETIVVGERTTINVQLIPDLQSLEELVVVGYGTQKKSDLTGAVASVNPEDLDNMSAPGIDRALQGRVAGVTVSANGGAPGSGTTVRIRGMASIYGNNGPLFVVDGIPLSDNNISNVVNSEDIQSIEVLKDAASAAIYGSRGSNGVIIVTTKKGKANQEPRLSVNGSSGISNPVNSPNLADAREFVELAETYYENIDRDVPTNIREIRENNFENIGSGTDWWNAIQRDNGLKKNYDIGLTGGSDDFTYATGVGYYDHKGFINASQYERLNLRLNVNYKFLEIFSAGSNLSFTNYTYKGVDENNPEGGVVAKAYQLSPIESIWKTEEQLIETANAGYDTTEIINRYAPVNSGGNIVRNIEQDNSYHKEDVLFGSFYLEASPFKGLKLRSEYGVDIRRRDDYNFSPRYWSSNLEKNDAPTVFRGYSVRNNWVWNNLATYSQSIGNHNFTLMGGVILEEFNYENLYGTGRNTPSNDPTFWYLSSTEEVVGTSGSASESALMSYLGRVNYSYANKYLFTFNIRRDGSSKFRTEEGRAWGLFPSFSGGWVLSEEEFFKNLNANWIYRFKLRASWGQVGNQSIPNNAFRPVLTSSTRDYYAFGPDEVFSVAYRPANNANPFLHWETSESINYAADIGFFGNRVQFTGEYFIRKSIDNLMLVPLPEYAGTPSAWANIGEIHNRGLELSLNYNNFDGALKYKIGGNITFLENEVISLGPGVDQIMSEKSGRLGFASSTARVGHPIGEFWGYQIDGIFDTLEEIEQYVGPTGIPIQNRAMPGDFRFADIAGAPDENGILTGPDGVINDYDKVAIGNPHPDFVYGFNVQMEYKGFSLNMFFQGQYGNDILMYEKYYNHKGYNAGWNQVSGLLEKSWSGPGTSQTDPILGASSQSYQISRWWLSDGSYLRAKNLTLSYALPSSWISNLRMSGMSVYVTGENLFTITDYEGLDPEIPFGSGLNLGIDRYTYPVSKNFIAGVKLNF
jgi:TonB-linked SusC/RagA family outer membrane protein